jgi:hypothetical protein
MSNLFMFGVRDLRGAPWLATGSYGSLVDFVGVNQLQVRDRVQNATLEGDDVELATVAAAIGADITIRFATTHSTTIDVYSVLSGKMPTSTSGGRRIGQGRGRFQYFGLIGQVMDEDDEAEHLIWIPKAKVVNGLSYEVAYGGFKIEDQTVQAVADGNLDAWYIYEHDPATGIPATLPPT